MKRLTTLITLSICLMISSLNAQSSSTFSIGELNPYFSEYLRPMALGMATGMGHGWAHQAAPHKTLGFDISVSVVGTAIPESDKKFSVSSLSDMQANGYQFLSSASGNPALAPTDLLPSLASSDEANAIMRKDINPYGGTPVDINMLDGILPENMAYAPNVAVQLAIGLPKGTEIIGRYVPDVGSTITKYAGIDDLHVNQLNMWGIGVKHDIKQWIPVVKKVPFLEISALLAYSEFNFDISTDAFSMNPEDLLSGANPIYTDINGDGQAPTSGSDFDGVGFGMHMNSLIGSILVGANIPIIKPFIGVGFNKASVNTGLTGNLPMIEFVDNLNVNVDYDPVGLNVKADRTFVNFQAGINFKILILDIHAQYTYQEYSMYSAGIALGFR